MTFYGQLLNLYCLTIAPSPALRLVSAETLILAEIQPCKILRQHTSLDIHFFKSYGTPLVFDVTCIQCVVGRMKTDSSNSNGEWAIIDRSGDLAQAYYTDEISTGDT